MGRGLETPRLFFFFFSFGSYLTTNDLVSRGRSLNSAALTLYRNMPVSSISIINRDVYESIWVKLVAFALLPFVVLFLKHSLIPSLPSLGPGSPRILKTHEWPVIGSVIQFYSKRRDMIVEGTAHSRHGNFSFHIGQRHAVNLGGLDGRKTFFEAKGFSVSQGYVYSSR